MSDYERIAEAIAFINAEADQQPSLAEVAAHLNLSQYHFQRLFSRWVGVTPKRYLQIITVDRAKSLLDNSTSLFDVSLAVGLSGNSRLHDHFVSLEAMSPGEFQSRGENLLFEYGEADSPFGRIFLVTTKRGIAQLSFLDHEVPDNPLDRLKSQWPEANYRENASEICDISKVLFNDRDNISAPISLAVSGTNFQINVWKALLQIPQGKMASYSQIAKAIGHPKAVRAVGTAVGANPVALLIPCHRVIRQNGGIGGYRWGTTRKHAMHAWESARTSFEDSESEYGGD